MLGTKHQPPAIVTLTPEKAAELLEHNQLNRPLADSHVRRIAKQIVEGKWRYNGDTIKVSVDGDVLDGQHRLWACIESKMPIETCLVYGIDRDAFATIDTLRKPRSGGDVLALNGVSRYRSICASAIAWLLRFQAGVLPTYKEPANRIENSAIEAGLAAHPGITLAVERAADVRRIGNQALIGFFYYVLSNRAPDLAERFLSTLREPAGVAAADPFYCLRYYFTSDHHTHKEPLVTIALMIKAANAAAEGRQTKVLNWRNQGDRPEAFPELVVGGKVVKQAAPLSEAAKTKARRAMKQARARRAA